MEVAYTGTGGSEQEHLRDHESSVVDDRTEHEIYVHPFMRAVQAGVASVMCSYSECFRCPASFVLDADFVLDQVNATWACENDRTLNQILKGELGFQGYIMSDWGAHHSTLAAVAGLDVRGSHAHISRYKRAVLIGTTRRCRCLAISLSTPARVGGART